MPLYVFLGRIPAERQPFPAVWPQSVIFKLHSMVVYQSTKADFSEDVLSDRIDVYGQGNE